MKLLFVAAVSHEKLLADLLKAQPRYYGIQGQYFMRLMLLGLRENGVDVRVLSNFLGASYLLAGNACEQTIRENGIEYNYLSRKRRGGYISTWRKAIRFIKQWKREAGNEKTVVLCDGLNFTLLMACHLCKWLYRIETVVFLTDMPRYLAKGLPARVRAWMQECIIHRMSGFMTLTRYMDEDLNRHHRPGIVIEGMVDASVQRSSAGTTPREKVCLYSGSIHKIYGIKRLVDSFLLMNRPGWVLEIYGDGDYREELVEIASHHACIVYGGLLSREQIVERQKQVSLLINPRPSEYEYTRYSFPSKTMEYMLSGTPVLTTKLPGIPAEYDQYLYYFEGESVEAMAGKLTEILSMDYACCLSRAKAAQQFVMSQKNNVTQMQKLISIL